MTAFPPFRGVQGLTLALAYFVTMQFSIRLAVAPGYASVLFPAAGLALAACFIWGGRPLPWIGAGTLASYWFSTWLPENSPVAIRLALALGASIGPMAQAALGGWLLRRMIGVDAAFDCIRQLVWLFAVAAFACVVSATLSLAVLWGFGCIVTADLPRNWLTWWAGDLLGVVLVLPVFLMFKHGDAALWRSRRFSIGVPVVLIAAFCVAGFLRLSEWEQQRTLAPFNGAAESLASHIEINFREQELLLDMLNGFMSHQASGEMTRDEFRGFVSRVLQRFPMLQAVQWVPQIAAERRAAFEAEQRLTQATFTIRERDSLGRWVSAAGRPIHAPITYAEPEAQSRMVMGYDLMSSPVRRDQLQQALTSESAISSPPIRLVEDDTPKFGLLLMQGVTHGSMAPGAVLTVIRVEDFIKALLPAQADWLELHFYDTQTGEAIYGSGVVAESATRFEKPLRIGTRDFRLVIVPTTAYMLQHPGWQSVVLLASALFGVALLQSLLLLASGYAGRVESSVAERTQLLRRESEKNRLLLHNASDGIHILDHQGRLIECSDTFCVMLGYPRTELIGMHLSQWEIGSNDEMLNARLASDLTSGSRFRHEAQHRRADGSTFAAEVSAVAVELDGKKVLFCASRDITQRRLTETTIIELNTRLQGMLDAAVEVAIIATDTEGCMTVFNRGAERMLGYRAAEMLGRSVESLHRPNEIRQRARHLSRQLGRTVSGFEVLVFRAQRGELDVSNWTYLRKDGSGMTVSLALNAIRAHDGHLIGYLGVARDVGPQLAAEAEQLRMTLNLDQQVKERTRELLEALSALEEAKDKLVQSEKLSSLGAIVAAVAHELNTPIGNCLMTATTIEARTRELEGKLASGLRRSDLQGYVEDVLGAMQIMQRGLERSASLVARFKETAVQAGNFERRVFDLGEVIRAAGEQVQAPFDFVCRVDDGIVMESYPTALGQVLSNMIDNAIRHGFAGRDRGRITLTAMRDIGYVGINFSDDGCGLSDEQQKRIFDPFYTSRLGQGGSGLGMYIAYNLVTGLLGGTLSAGPASRSGCSFSLRLPLVAPIPESAQVSSDS